MKCPNCEERLIMTERSGVEIDYCPNCRGVWLDKGELDKIIEKSSPAQSARPGKEKYNQFDEDDDSNDQRKGRNRKGGFLGDLFDFG